MLPAALLYTIMLVHGNTAHSTAYTVIEEFYNTVVITAHSTIYTVIEQYINTIAIAARSTAHTFIAIQPLIAIVEVISSLSSSVHFYGNNYYCGHYSS